MIGFLQHPKLNVLALRVVLVICPTLLFAQRITMEIEPATIRLNEMATLKLNFFNLNPAQAPGIPPVDGFELNFMGQEQHFQFSNGAQERRLTFNYRISPRATGTFTIGPFKLDINGQTIDIDAAAIEVLPPSSESSGGQTQTMSDLIFARVTLPRQEVFLQERFDVELAIYYRGIQIDRGISLQNLPTTGLNLEDFEETSGGREVRGNELFEVRKFRMRGTALTAGTFTLDPMVQVGVLVQRQRQRDPFFGDLDFFFGRYQTQPLTVATEPVSVTIRPLPAEGRPEGFGGAVGRFDMDAGVQPSEVTAGEPVTLTLRITGQGNFESISMPPLNLGDDFRPYDPRLVSTGRDHKVFEQVFIPRTDAVQEIPPVTFAFFDPESGAYRTISRGPYPLNVKPGSTPAGPQLVQAPTPQAAIDRAPLGIDLLDIKRTVRPVTTSPSAWTRIQPLTHVLPLMALTGLWLIQRRRASLRMDIRHRRRSQAPRSARAMLKMADQARTDGDSLRFHQSLWQALADYVAHRCNLEAGQVSPEVILARARAGGLDDNTVEELTALMRECEEARFAGTTGAQATWDQRRETTERMLRALEKVRLT